jgi:hypothetical protein
MKAALIILALLALNLRSVPGCGGRTGNGTVREVDSMADSRQGDLQKAYVEEAQATTLAAAGEETVINVSGNLPSPAYKLERVEVKIKGNVVELTPLASFDRSRMAAQVLVPFSEVVKVKLPKAGEYTVRVVGRSENRESKITVKSK